MTELTGRCTCCRKRDPRYGPVCDACRSRLASWLRDIPDLHAELEARDDPAAQPRDVREGTRAERVRDTDGRSVLVRVSGHPADPAAFMAPTGPVPGPGNGGRVTGSREAPVPIRVNPTDLTAPARVLALTDLGSRYGHRPHDRYTIAEHHADQVGYLSVASILDGWVRDWREVLNLNEGLPGVTVPELVRWLYDRADLACDHYPSIDACMDELGKLRSTLRGQLGLIDKTELRLGVACRRCDHRGVLARLNGSDWFECTWIDEHGYRCPELMSPQEFDDWVRLDAGYIPAETRKEHGL